MEIKKIIIIPDVHGRTFWKEPVMKYKDDPETHIVFLGDYLDSYDFEHIAVEDVMLNFEDIIYTARNSTNITLLIGNHDLHYFPMFLNDWGCRKINKYKNDICYLFEKNIDLFKIAWNIDLDGKKYLFTHAGITPLWWEKISNKELGKTSIFKPSYKFWNSFEKIVTPDDIKFAESLELNADSLNQLINYKIGLIGLSIVGKSRGGYDYTGSCLWADIHDHFDSEWWEYHKGENDTSENFYKQFYQIFSHTLSYPSLNEYYIGENFAMLDACKAFILDCDTKKINEFV